ncbi:high mobility group B protein 7-like isoform X1 [Lycium barbarum]|uniref:high mobility group B protein 7-like isoform X1 n=1 Tax=Lycium barbarum TaxID=112863 RepID=UPI00293E14A5|nr:high mobility group B protein 7-like isoform X1 [Lycium barbarum]XP_060184976.1 high mobility group B protein 7-like isoform X1 [Lycium barbarum]
MGGGGATKSTSNGNGPTRVRKRVEVESAANATLKRAKDGSAFARCEECSKDVPIALISFHNCSLDAKIKMNLEAQVVENPTETKKPSAKSKEKTTEPKAKREKKLKNPNAPKRPPTAFFVFMDDFRQTFKAANPDCKSVSTVAKEGGEKWKSMTDEEKKPYQDKAAELKAAYEKALKSNTDTDENANDEDDEPEKEVKEEIEVVEGVKEEIEDDDA